MQRITVIHAGAIGDLIQTLPALAAVRRRWPAASVTIVGRPERAVLALLAGAAHHVVDLETSGLWRTMGPASAAPAQTLPDAVAQADLVIDFLTGGAVASALAARRDVLPSISSVPAVATVEPIPPAGWTRSAAEWICDSLGKTLGIEQAEPVPVIRVTDELLDAARRLLSSAGVRGGLVAIHPGSGSVSKNWPAERYADLARYVREHLAGRQPVFLVGPAELERRTLPAGLAAGSVVLARVALDRLAAVLAMADAYVGSDSGISHLAGAVRRPDGGATPTIVLFGPTDPRVWAPRGDHVRVIRAPDGRMESVGPGQVLAALRGALAPADSP